MNAEEIYVSIGRLLEATPDFRSSDSVSTEETKWMARAYALMTAAHMGPEIIEVRSKMQSVGTGGWSKSNDFAAIVAALERALAVAELNAPTSVRGAFISAGSAFDAMAVVGSVLAQANTVARIVDPYMDEKALTDFAVLAGEQVRIELLTDSAHMKPSLRPAVQRWAPAILSHPRPGGPCRRRAHSS